MTLYIANPAFGNRKPVELITDRAKRYRANAPGVRPPGPRSCLLCRSRKNVDVMHLDGNESNGDTSNLAYGCRSCNTRLGKAFARKGLGVRTRQYNPSTGEGAKSLGAWLSAIQILHGGAGDLAAAVRTVRGTSHAERSKFQGQAWAARKRVYGPSGRSGANVVPF